MVKKKVSFIANGKRVTFYTKPPSRRKASLPRRRVSVLSGRNRRIRRDTERVIEAGLPLIHPALPLVKAGAQLMRDILDA